MASIKVLYGQPSPEELAAVIAVLHTRATPAPAAPAAPPGSRLSAWADRGTAMAIRQLTLRHLAGLPHAAYGGWARSAPHRA